MTKRAPGTKQARLGGIEGPRCERIWGMLVVNDLFRLVVRRAKSSRARSVLVGTVLIVGAAFLLWFVNQYYPLRHWLFFSYLRAWLCVLGFAVSCLSSGWWMLKVILPTSPRLSERLLLAFSAGVLVFYVVLFTAGILGLYSSALFFALPLALFALGAPRIVGDWRWLRPRLGGYLGHLVQPQHMLHGAAVVLCVVAIVAIYLQVLLPSNVHADSHWYHLPIAEHYVAAGGIVRFHEGWYVGCYPQLASILYAWAFLSPGDLFAHVVLCAHLDFALFVVTVLGVSALAARVLKIRHFPYAGATVFLFPGLFMYDSNVNANSDHVLAFWVVVLGVALVRLAAQFDVREAVLAGLFAGGAASTKYQASYVIVPTMLLVSYLVVRHRKLVPALVWLATTGAVSATHWLKNLIYYHDPFYPLLYRYLPLTPFHEGAGELMERTYWLRQFAPTGLWFERLLAALKTLATFSFLHNDWDFHGARPVFGSLFTLVIPALLVVRARKRLWGLVFGTHLGLMVWYLTSHQDRFLQALLPWMAAATAAILSLVWQRGLIARIGAATLVLAQLVWGLDVYFIRKHNMIGDSPIRAVAEYLDAGHTGDYEGRYVIASTEQKVFAALPEDATLLSHTYMSRLGLGVKVVADGVGWQGAIEYLLHETPSATAEIWKPMGITHVMRHGDPDSLDLSEAAREIVFHRWLALYGGVEHKYDDVKLARVMSRPKDEVLANQATTIAWLDCSGRPALGLYTPRGLLLHMPIRLLSVDDLWQHPSAELTDATAIAQHGNCRESLELMGVISGQFDRRMNAGHVSLWVRTERPLVAE